MFTIIVFQNIVAKSRIPVSIVLAGLIVFQFWENWIAKKPDTKNIPTVKLDHAEPVIGYNLQAIAQQQLFGQPKAPNKPQPIVLKAPAPAPAVKLPPLDIRLVGIVNRGSDSGVAILTHEGRQQAYLAGEYLNTEQTVQLEKVEEGTAILNRGEQTITLHLPEELKQSATIKKTLSVFANSESTIASTRSINSLLENTKEEVNKHHTRLDQLIPTQPYRIKGRYEGLVITNGGDAQLLAAVQLQEGDIITAVNGRSLKSRPLRSLSAALSTKKSLQLQRSRNGDTATISLF